MLQGECDLNSVQMYSGSFKEVLKQTMLSQEVMFRKQVLELHRLYGVQKILMQKFGFKEFDRCSFKQAPNFMPCTNPSRYDPLVKETEVSSISMLEERRSKNYKLQNRPLDLQLPADQYITLIGLESEELNLSLDIGSTCREKESAKEVFLWKKSCILPKEVYDLEDSNDGDAENGPSLNYNAPTIKYTEFENIRGHLSSDDLAIKNKHSGSYEAGYLDLNEVMHDDSSCHSNDPFTSNYSTSSSSPGSKGMVGKVPLANCSSPIWVKEKNSCFIEASKLEEDANLDLMDSGSRNESMEIHTTEPDFKGENASEKDIQCDETPVEPKVNYSKDFSNCDGDESKSFEAVIELPVSVMNDKNCVPPVYRHTRLQKNEECSDCSQIAQDGCDSILTVSGTSACIAENDSSGVKNMPISSLLTTNQCITETAFDMQLEKKSPDSIGLEHDEEPSEMKLLIRNAAESLVCISLADSICTHDSNTKIESNVMEKDLVEQPQYSFDSFELLVLKQKENNEDEYSVSSNPTEVIDMENKDFGFKLRRGRRLKDFQKEILPGLSSLSRHEICEDINILEAVLRSREYRKIRAKMPGGNKWFAPMKNKRSRLNNVRRRIIL